MANPWDNDPVDHGAPWEKDPIAGSGPAPSRNVAPPYAPSQSQDINPAIDAIASIPGGLAGGFAGLAGGFGEIASLGTPSSEPPPQTALSRLERAIRPGNVLPTTGAIYNAMGSPFGGFYEPKTTAGKYAKTIASFVPAALAPGSIPTKIARVLGPAIGSEFAGQMAEGTPYEVPARIGGGLVGGAVAGAIPGVYDFGKRAVNKAITAVGGKDIIDPEAAAARYLAPAIKRQDPAQVAARIADWESTGADSPAWVDVGSGEFRRRVRSAASTPEGATPDLVRDYQHKVTGNIQDRATRLAENLTPGSNESAEAYTKGLEETRRTLASEKYAAPYEAKVPLSKDLATGLFDAEGRAAIGAAIKDSRINLDYKTVKELQDLQNNVEILRSGQRLRNDAGRLVKPEDAQQLSGRALDRVRIAMRELGNSAAANQQNYRARGYFTRVGLIDSALDNAPGLIPARAEYRSISKQIEAVPLGQSAVQRNVVEQLAPMEGMEKAAAGIGYRDAAINTIQHPAAGATGILNRLGTSTEQANTQSALFGQEASGKFRTGLMNEISRIQNARYINPDIGSQTMPRTLDNMVIDAMPTTKAAIIPKLISALRGGSLLTPAQSERVVKMALSPAQIRAISATFPPREGPNVLRSIAISSLLARAGAQGRDDKSPMQEMSPATLSRILNANPRQ